MRRAMKPVIRSPLLSPFSDLVFVILGAKPPLVLLGLAPRIQNASPCLASIDLGPNAGWILGSSPRMTKGGARG